MEECVLYDRSCGSNAVNCLGTRNAFPTRTGPRGRNGDIFGAKPAESGIEVVSASIEGEYDGRGSLSPSTIHPLCITVTHGAGLQP